MDGFNIFQRSDLIFVLNSFQNIHSDIFNDFKDYILDIENEVNAFKTKESWGKKNWIGFFKFLQSELQRGDWSYVANQSGGFMGYWWAFQYNSHCTQYLQIQENDLVLKINCKNSKNSRKNRDICYKHFLARGKEQGLLFNKPSRFGIGDTMTVLVTKYLVRRPDNNLVDLQATLENIKAHTLFIENNYLREASFID